MQEHFRFDVRDPQGSTYFSCGEEQKACDEAESLALKNNQRMTVMEVKVVETQRSVYQTPEIEQTAAEPGPP